MVLENTRKWVAKVGKDLHSATIDLMATPPEIEDALFHCQQAVEKILKAFLTFHNCPFRKTHNLDELGQTCGGIDPTILFVIAPAAGLTAYATDFRYPGDFPDFTVADAEERLSLARDVVDAVLCRLPDEVRK